MVNKGVVTQSNNGMLTIIFERHEACGDCHACALGSENCKKHTLSIRGNANPGDEVEVEVDDSNVMLASMFAYIIPLLGFILGLVVGYLLSQVVAFNQDLLMSACGVIGIALGYLIMRALDPKVSKGRWEPRIVRITPAQNVSY